MKRYLVFALAIIFAFFVSCAIAADPTWTLNGTWNYKATIPSTTIKTGDVVSATESGTITMNMTTKDGAEYFDSYVIKGKGTAWLNGTSYPYDFPGTKQLLAQTKYTPGVTFAYNDTVYIASGITANARYELVQTGANSVLGTIVMTWDGNTASGTISATRPTDSGGGCNAGLAGLALLALVPLFYRKKK